MENRDIFMLFSHRPNGHLIGQKLNKTGLFARFFALYKRAILGHKFAPAASASTGVTATSGHRAARPRTNATCHSEELRPRKVFSRAWTQRPRNSGLTRPCCRREASAATGRGLHCLP